MKRSRFLCLLICLVLLFSLVTPSYASQNQLISVTPINVMVGGKVFLPTDANGKNVPVFVYNGTTYAPLRALAEAYGLTVGYNAEKKLATVTGTPSANFAGSKGTAQALTKSAMLLVSPINIEVNGKVFQPKDANGNSVSVFTYNGTTYAPLRALAEAYGLTVGYDSEKKLATVDFTAANTIQLVAPRRSANVFPTGPRFPSLAFFAGDAMEFRNAETTGEQTLSHEFECRLDAYTVIKAYVDLLVQEYSFKLVETPYYKTYNNSGGKKTYFDFLLNYTGPLTLSGDKSEGFSGAMADVRIYGAADYSSVDGHFIYNNSLTAYDTGERYSSANLGTAMAGKSAADALYRLSDGSYRTEDGRLQAAVGQAAVISGSSKKTCTARYEEVPGKTQRIFVEDANGTTLLRLMFEDNHLINGSSVYTGDSLTDNRIFFLDDGAHESSSFSDLHKVYALHNGKYYSALPGLNGEILRLNVRVLYWDANNEAVLHVGILFEHSPQEEEYLIAVSIGEETHQNGNSSGGGSGSDTPEPSDGTTPRLRCTFSGCDDGEIECSVCDGEGGWREYDTSTPGYGTNPDRWEWKRCSNCGGDGEVACRRCGGDGWMD